MEVDPERTRITNNFDTGQQYDHTQYVCKPDDIWVSVEVPKNS